MQSVHLESQHQNFLVEKVYDDYTVLKKTHELSIQK